MVEKISPQAGIKLSLLDLWAMSKQNSVKVKKLTRSGLSQMIKVDKSTDLRRPVTGQDSSPVSALPIT